MTEPTISDLERAARHLAGRRCTVRLTQPCVAGARGVAYIDMSGEARIDILPGQTEPILLDTLCHEAAHIRLGHAPRGVYASLQPGFYDDTARRKAQARPIEGEAERLAAGWVKFAHDHAQEYGGSPWQALTRWIDPALKAILDRAVKTGVAMALSRLGK